MKKRRIILLLIWILSLVGISFYGGPVSYGFFFAVTLVPVISVVYAVAVYWRFHIFQKIESHDIVCRQEVPYHFVLQNEDYFGFASIRVKMFDDFSTLQEMKEDAEYELLPGDRYVHDTSIICKYRGQYEVGIKEVHVTDFFRFFTFKYKNKDTIKALVSPRMISLEEVKGIGELIAHVQKENTRLDTEPDVVVRDYVSGDSLKWIHWKATAKEWKLKTRTRTGEEKQGVVLHFDDTRYSMNMQEYLPAESQLLETFLAIGLFLAQRHIPYSVFRQEEAFHNCKVTGMPEYHKLYELMDRRIFIPKKTGGEEFRYALERTLYQGDKVFIGVLGKLDSNMLSDAVAFSEEGISIVLYVITDEDMGEFIKQGNERLKVIRIETEVPLEDVL